MCIACWRGAGEPRIVNPAVRKAAQAIAALYERHAAGGQMHIVTDDWNADDDNLDFCFKHRPGSMDSLELACYEAMRQLSVEERYSALALEGGFFAAPPKPEGG